MKAKASYLKYQYVCQTDQYRRAMIKIAHFRKFKREYCIKTNKRQQQQKRDSLNFRLLTPNVGEAASFKKNSGTEPHWPP